MEQMQFWQQLESNVFFTKYILQPQMREWYDIVSNWNHSSVKLKNWLNTYFPTEYGKYDCFMDINVNHILPYRHNSFWGNDDLWRLEYAIKCKLIILGQHGMDEVRTQYAIECLRLWLRYNSKVTKLDWNGFTQLIDKCYVETEQDWFGTVELCQNICKKYKFKRKQTMYHYEPKDFNLINADMTLSEAYKFWLYYEFPNILDNFKKEKIREFQVNELKLHKTISNEKYLKFKKDLDLVKIKEPSIRAFAQLLKRNNIAYKKQ